MIQFLVTLLDSHAGVPAVLVQKVEASAGQYTFSADFQTVQMDHADGLDLHLEGSNGRRTLVRIAVDDDTIPTFASTEEAEAWMEQRSRQVIR